MRANIKKLGVFVAIFSIALFTAATASAFDHNWKAIHGEYAFIGSGACLFAPGFTDDTHFTPTGPSTMGPNTWEGVYTFNRDGTGEMQAVNRLWITSPVQGWRKFIGSLTMM